MDKKGFLIIQHVFPSDCTCGYKVGSKCKEFLELSKKSSGVKALDHMGIIKMCCRLTFLTPKIIYMIDKTKNIELYENYYKEISSKDLEEIEFGKKFPKLPSL
jgi:DNA-directed RNA polymerase subunit N (RpoN/RPB10)